MTLDSVPVHSGRLFTWESGRGTTEASVLYARVIASRLYDDACDVGFWIESHRTGKRLLFAQVRELRNDDNDIVAWEYESTAALGPKICITIWND